MTIIGPSIEADDGLVTIGTSGNGTNVFGPFQKFGTTLIDVPVVNVASKLGTGAAFDVIGSSVEITTTAFNATSTVQVDPGPLSGAPTFVFISALKGDLKFHNTVLVDGNGVMDGADGAQVVMTAAGKFDTTGQLLINANGQGQAGDGGLIKLSGTTFPDVTADKFTLAAIGGGNGGGIDISSGENLVVDSSRFDAHANLNGLGGGILLSSVKNLKVEGQLNANGSGSGNGGTIILRGEVISTDKLLSARGGLDAGNGGVIKVIAQKGLTISANNIDVTAGVNGDGGFIHLESGLGGGLNVIGSGSLNADGSGTGNGGTVELWSGEDFKAGAGGNVTSASAIGGNAGGSGGYVNMESQKNLIVNASAIKVDNGGGNGNGGVINLQAGFYGDPNAFPEVPGNGAMVVDGSLNANGSGTGNGGAIILGAGGDGEGSPATGSILLSGNLNANSGKESGDGGFINVLASGPSADWIAQSSHYASAKGTDRGGTVAITTGRHLIVGAGGINVNVTGKDGDGGSIGLTAGFSNPLLGDLTVLQNLSVDGKGVGAGGNISLNSGHAIIANTNLSADAGTEGIGGGITFTAFSTDNSITVSGGRTLTAQGGKDSGAGGNISMNGVGSVQLEDATINVNARGDGDGGAVSIFTIMNSAKINFTEGKILANAGKNGNGGFVLILATGGANQVNLGSSDKQVIIKAQGGRTTGSGGFVGLSSDSRLSANVQIDVGMPGGSVGTGGSISLDSSFDGSGTLEVNGKLLADGRGEGGNGGSITATAHMGNAIFGNLGTVSISAQGGNSGDTGDGGMITVSAFGNLDLLSGSVKASSLAQVGTGGTVTFDAGTGGQGALVYGFDLVANGGKAGGNGGKIMLSHSSESTMQINGDMTANSIGDDYPAGDVLFTQNGDFDFNLELGGNFKIDGDGSMEIKKIHAGKDILINLKSSVDLRKFNTQLGRLRVSNGKNVFISSNTGKGKLDGSFDIVANSIGIVLNSVHVKNLIATDGDLSIGAASILSLNQGSVLSGRNIFIIAEDIRDSGAKIEAKSTIAIRSGDFGPSLYSLDANSIFLGPKDGTILGSNGIKVHNLNAASLVTIESNGNGQINSLGNRWFSPEFLFFSEGGNISVSLSQAKDGNSLGATKLTAVSARGNISIIHKGALELNQITTGVDAFGGGGTSVIEVQEKGSLYVNGPIRSNALTLKSDGGDILLGASLEAEAVQIVASGEAKILSSELTILKFNIVEFDLNDNASVGTAANPFKFEPFNVGRHALLSVHGIPVSQQQVYIQNDTSSKVFISLAQAARLDVVAGHELVLQNDGIINAKNVSLVAGSDLKIHGNLTAMNSVFLESKTGRVLANGLSSTINCPEIAVTAEKNISINTVAENIFAESRLGNVSIFNDLAPYSTLYVSGSAPNGDFKANTVFDLETTNSLPGQSSRISAGGRIILTANTGSINANISASQLQFYSGFSTTINNNKSARIFPSVYGGNQTGGSFIYTGPPLVPPSDVTGPTPPIIITIGWSEIVVDESRNLNFTSAANADIWSTGRAEILVRNKALKFKNGIGELIIEAKEPLIFELGSKQISIARNAIVEIIGNTEAVTIRCLHDSRKGSVFISSGSDRVALNVGETMVISDCRERIQKERVQQGLSYRNSITASGLEGVFGISEFSATSAFTSDLLLKTVMQSKDPNTKCLRAKLTKTAAALILTSNGHGAFNKEKEAPTFRGI